MPRKLKVFRTPIGFHDAYVAAPSRKAALAAWGADADLFARGVAEEVTDPALTAAPLARPGEVVRVVRGTMAEHLAALPEAGPGKGRTAKARSRMASPEPLAPRPSRDGLDTADAALEEAERRHAEARRAIERREADLQRERRQLDRDHERCIAELQKARDTAEADYRRALADWRAT